MCGPKEQRLVCVCTKERILVCYTKESRWAPVTQKKEHCVCCRKERRVVCVYTKERRLVCVTQKKED